MNSKKFIKSAFSILIPKKKEKVKEITNIEQLDTKVLNNAMEYITWVQ